MLGLSWASSLTGAASGNANAVDAASKTITAFLREEPPQLDSSRATDQVSGMVLGHVIEGLLRYDEHNQLAPGVAEALGNYRRRRHLLVCARTPAGVMASRSPPTTSYSPGVWWWTRRLPPNTATSSSRLKTARRSTTASCPSHALGVRRRRRPHAGGDLRTTAGLFRQTRRFRTYAPIREDFFARPMAPTVQTRTNCSTTVPSPSPAGCMARASRMKKNPHYWNQNRTSNRSTGFPLHHLGCQCHAEPLQGRQDRLRDTAGRKPERSHGAGLAHQPFHGRLGVLH